MSVSGWEAFLDVQCDPDSLSKVREWSRGPHRSLGVVVRPSRMSWSGRMALPDVRLLSGGPPRCLGVVGRPYRMSGSSREALPNV